GTLQQSEASLGPFSFSESRETFFFSQKEKVSLALSAEDARAASAPRRGNGASLLSPQRQQPSSRARGAEKCPAL
ncbi:MAG: hypothetical protein LBM18_02545, partial [Oscillospiraceae bacterium]|nr:hypothetical protein [Oscillospiraceae bacterium]